MKEQLITQVQQRMLTHLNNEQLMQLREAMEYALHGFEITPSDQSQKQEQPGAVAAFITAKRIEGCSEKTLRYYQKTIEAVIAELGKTPQQITTEDLRQYLTKYQVQRKSSKVTIDNIRRILASFYSWLEDEDYIVKSPVRRIHKVKTAKVIKDTYTDEALELMRDNCGSARDLAIIDLLASSGMRVGELVTLNRDDINFNERECVVFGKSVIIDGEKCDNMDGRYGKRYYMEDTHEGIVSKETYYRAQEIRQQRKNPLLVGSKHEVYPFTGIIECGVCGKHYNHKVNNSGKKWRTDIWACSRQLRKGVAECDCTRIKDSVLREKFIEAYNEFVTKRPQGDSIDDLQAVVDELRAEESDLAALRMQRLIPEASFRAEQRRIKEQIAALQTEINEQKGKTVSESDFTIIADFDPVKVEKFITKVIVRKGTVTFVFYNGIKISRTYSNGPSGNQVGWMQKREAAAWQQ